MSSSSSSIRRTRNPGEPNPFYKRRLAEGLTMSSPLPTHFLCPISLDMMTDPVTASTGITYDRRSIETWLDMGGNSTCPVTNQPLSPSEDLIPNHSLRRMIQDWCVSNRSYGVERIPTPRTPLTLTQASDLLSEIVSATRNSDHARCFQLLKKMKELGRDRERNRRCFASVGAAGILATSFHSFEAAVAAAPLLEEILSAMVVYLPLDEYASKMMASRDSLSSISTIASLGDSAARLNAAVVIERLVASSKELVRLVGRDDGVIEALVKLLKEPISTQATKASLLATYRLVEDERVARRFVEAGVVDLTIEMLVEADRSVSEKALAVLERMCVSEKGRERASRHALTVPVLVKKMFRVSDVATELAVSALWRLCMGEEGEGCAAEAMQVGAFQKMLLLLQVGCSSGTKEKATEMLKMLNGFKGRRLDCIETLDLRGLKRPS